MTRASYPVPFNEQQRLEALRSYRILDTAAEPRFDRLVDIARALFDAPIAVITLIDEDRQWFKAVRGMTVGQTDRDAAFCAHTIMQDEILLVRDAMTDPRFANNPLVIKAPYIRFYVGAPLITAAGFRLGSICVIDTAPRPRPRPSALAALKTLAAMVIDELEAGGTTDAPEQAGLAGPSPEPPADPSQAAKEEFLMLVSHELRTPLNAILGFSEILDNWIKDEPYQSYVKDVLTSAHQLRSTVDHILEFSRAEQGELTLKEEKVSVSDTVREVIDTLAGHARLAGVTLSMDLSTPFPTLTADRIYLRQMISNVVNNAIQSGATFVRVEAGPPTETDVSVTIVDNGRGIDPDTSLSVLGAFRQGEAILSRRKDGLGLGLPMTRRLVELHGGRLALNPGPGGVGTAARLTFPAWRL
ncbi:MAG: GAF domain-containing sensor histidine kinase [Inquilinaceae bacterium]